MNALIIYLAQSATSLILLYGIYWLFLRKDTFFHINRIYLVFSILFSLFMPLLKIKLFYPDAATTYSVMLDAITINANSLEPAISKNIDTFQVLSLIYFAGICIFLLRFIIQVGQLAFLVKRNTVLHRHGFNIIELDRNYAPFSFFHLIFINSKAIDKNTVEAIISHEQVHSMQLHSMDIVLLELLTIVQWFNPFVWFYRASLKTVHEYLADEGVLQKGFNAINYQTLLLQQCTGVPVNGLTNNFNHSLIKKRIIMMTKNKSNFMAKLKLLLVTPVAFMLVVVFTTSPMVKTFAQDEVAPKENVVKDIPQNKPDEQIFVVVEEMPEFPGGKEARIKYMNSKIIYPAEARKAGIEGRVFVSFVVEKDGSISNPKILRGFDKACDEVALNAVKEMPAWEPGKQRGQVVRVQFNMPVSFKLDSGKTVNEKGTKPLPSTPPTPPPPPKEGDGGK